MHRSSRAVASALAIVCTVCSAPAQDPATGIHTIQVPGSAAKARVSLTSDGSLHYSLSTNGVTFTAPTPARYELLLRYAQFDPLAAEPPIPKALRAAAANRLFVVQYHTQALEEYRAPIAAMGAENLLFLANHANVWAMAVETAAAVRHLPWVRAVVPFHPA
jgi:hypothetical protein